MKCNVNRRYFLKKLRAALVVSSYVSVLKAFDNVRDADCPGGGPDYDICNEADPDSCPGERPPIDECEKGGREQDYCDTGSADADVCSSEVAKSDQCSSGKPNDDSCSENEDNKDVCYSGASPDPDACPDAGGIADGDNCPGGSMSVDNCGADGKGEECSPEEGWFGIAYGSDTCNEENDDDCHVNADVCNDGTNTLTGSGGGDSCGPAYGIGEEGSDTCNNGHEEQDKCGTIEGDPDLCIVSSVGDHTDFCNPTAKYPSDDVCFQGVNNSDTCDPNLEEEDECPGGAYPADECSTSYPEEDICMPEDALTDHCDYGSPNDDECFGLEDFCNSGNQDTVE